MLVTIFLVNGFQETVSSRVYSFWGLIHVQSYEQAQALVTEETPFQTSPALEQVIENADRVNHIQPVTTTSTILERGR